MNSSEGRTQRGEEQRRQERRGERAEQVASWYFRLNGFLSIPGFVVHPDRVRHNPMTEADLIAVRFPHSAEEIAGRCMEDDPRLADLAASRQILFLLVEVKVSLCNINGPWSDRGAGNMQRVIRRMGFADGDERISEIADTMYSALRWENPEYVLQYLTVGQTVNDGHQRQYPLLRQITWDMIAQFLFRRFKAFPEKLPEYGWPIHKQWPDFGRYFGERVRRLHSVEEAQRVVWEYIDRDRAAT